MRPDNLDENGVRTPFTNFTDYNKLMHLVPEAQCSTRGGVITEWKDQRPQPTYDEIEAVTEEEAELAGKPTSEDLLDSQNEVIQAILDASPGLRNRVAQGLMTKRGK